MSSQDPEEIGVERQCKCMREMWTIRWIKEGEMVQRLWKLRGLVNMVPWRGMKPGSERAGNTRTSDEDGYSLSSNFLPSVDAGRWKFT